MVYFYIYESSFFIDILRDSIGLSNVDFAMINGVFVFSLRFLRAGVRPFSPFENLPGDFSPRAPGSTERRAGDSGSMEMDLDFMGFHGHGIGSCWDLMGFNMDLIWILYGFNGM
jgi:hypothetical protein